MREGIHYLAELLPGGEIGIGISLYKTTTHSQSHRTRESDNIYARINVRGRREIVRITSNVLLVFRLIYTNVINLEQKFR